MKKAVKSLISVAMVISIILSFNACSSAPQVTEETAKETVELAVNALKEFNTDDLNKYVNSETLSYIIKLAEEHEQFAELGKAMFESLSITISEVNIEQKTVTVQVINRDLFYIASNFTYDLTSKYTSLQMLSLLDDEFFLDNSLKKLTDEIYNAPIASEVKTVTLKIVEKKKNLAIEVDETAEDAISGGVLRAVKGIVKA